MMMMIEILIRKSREYEQLNKKNLNDQRLTES